MHDARRAVLVDLIAAAGLLGAGVRDTALHSAPREETQRSDAQPGRTPKGSDASHHEASPMTALRLAPGLELPLDVVTQKLAFLGRTGSGKTYGATKLAELMLEHEAQIVALDPVGVWYGLRIGGGLTIPVLGGMHGDVPLESTAGAEIADYIVDRGISAVLDVSQFETDTQKARFAEKFAERFFFRKKAAPSAVHLFLEECQEFVPQNPSGGEADMLHYWTRMAKLGRNFGIGVSLISQRPQEVNKKVLNMTEALFAFQMRGEQERKTIKAWSNDKALDVDIVDELPSLAVGECFVSSPQWLQIEKKVKIAKKRTADVSSTPKVGAAAVSSRELTPIDLAELQKTMAATIEKAKATDPKELHKRIRELEAQIRKGAPASAPDPAAVQRQVDAAVATTVRTVKQRLDAARVYFAKANALASQLPDLLDTGIAGIDLAVEGLPAPSVAKAPAVSRASSAAAAAHTAAPVRREVLARVESTNGADPLGKGERATLIAIAQHDDGVTREQLTTLTGYKRSTRNTYLQRLGAAGHIEYRGEKVLATESGRAALGHDYEPLPTGDALREHWIGRLPEGERKILQALITVWPDSMGREALSGMTGFTRSTRNTYLQRLSSRKLVENFGDGVRASDMLFGS